MQVDDDYTLEATTRMKTMTKVNNKETVSRYFTDRESQRERELTNERTNYLVSERAIERARK